MSQSNTNRYIGLTDWPKYHPWPKVGGLRNLMVKAKSTGFDKVIRKIGGKIVISEKDFFEWIDSKKVTG